MSAKTAPSPALSAADAAAQLADAEQAVTDTTARVEQLRTAVIHGDVSISAVDIATAEAAARHAVLLVEAARRNLADATKRERVEAAHQAAADLIAECTADTAQEAPTGRQMAEELQQHIRDFITAVAARNSRVGELSRRAHAIAVELAEADGQPRTHANRYQVDGVAEAVSAAAGHGPWLRTPDNRARLGTDKLPAVLASMLVDLMDDAGEMAQFVEAVDAARNYRTMRGHASTLRRFLPPGE